MFLLYILIIFNYKFTSVILLQNINFICILQIYKYNTKLLQ